MKKAAAVFLNLILFLASLGVISALFWHFAGVGYLFSKQPIGSDYFNALTYLKFFHENLGLPPQLWNNLWNEGTPVIGGYPWLTFYLIEPLVSFFGLSKAMDVFSIASLFLFFAFSLCLFKAVSKNWLVSFSLTLILIFTRATYYPLMTGGFIASAGIQWYLPLILLFIYKFRESGSYRYLSLASIFGGISLLQHAPTSLVMIILPTLVLFTALPSKNWKKRIYDSFIFAFLSALIGSAGLYSLYLQTFLGSGGDLCQNPQCWGIYPKHLVVWLTLLSPAVVYLFSVIAIEARVFKKTKLISLALPPFLAFLVPIGYGIAAYYRLIDGLANVIFPTRFFWAANFLLLVLAAALFRSFYQAYTKLGWIVSLITLAFVGYFVWASPPKIHHEFMATVPIYAYKHILPQYKSFPIGDLAPDWALRADPNWRLDTFQSGLTHWWNFISPVPSVRGYSDHPIGLHKDWQYFLQVATRNPQGPNQEMIKNKALFLIDAFGIGYRENSIASYPPSILDDPEIMVEHNWSQETQWYKLSPDYTSPIVYPTKADPVLFIGDNLGYENWIRTLAMVNLHSQLMVPVQGPENINRLKQEELKKFKALVLYRFSGNDWSKIASYVQDGGFVFIDTAQSPSTSKKLADIFPVEFWEVAAKKGDWKPKIAGNSPLGESVDTKSFAPLEFEGKEWRLTAADKQAIRAGAREILTDDDRVLMVQGKFGRGQVFWSGVNLLFHIVKNDNFEEAKLFKNILTQALENHPKPEYQVQRPNPQNIKITGKDFTGIYFKENYDSGWRAKVNGKGVKAYQAGLGFMYFPVAEKEIKGPLQVSITYQGSFVAWILFILTCLSAILSILYLIIPKIFQSAALRITHMFKKHGFERVRRWAHEDEG